MPRGAVLMVILCRCDVEKGMKEQLRPSRILGLPPSQLGCVRRHWRSLAHGGGKRTPRQPQRDKQNLEGSRKSPQSGAVSRERHEGRTTPPRPRSGPGTARTTLPRGHRAGMPAPAPASCR